MSLFAASVCSFMFILKDSYIGCGPYVPAIRLPGAFRLDASYQKEKLIVGCQFYLSLNPLWFHSDSQVSQNLILPRLDFRLCWGGFRVSFRLAHTHPPVQEGHQAVKMGLQKSLELTTSLRASPDGLTPILTVLP